MFFRHNNLFSFIITNNIERLFSLYHTPSENTLSSFLKEFHKKKRYAVTHTPSHTAFPICFFALPALPSVLLPQPFVPHHAPSDTAQTTLHHIPPAVLPRQYAVTELLPSFSFSAVYSITV